MRLSGPAEGSEGRLLREAIASADTLEAHRAALALLAIGASAQAVRIDAAKPAATAVDIKDTLRAGRFRIFHTGARRTDLTECALRSRCCARSRTGPVYAQAARCTLRITDAERTADSTGGSVRWTTATGDTRLGALAGRVVLASVDALGKIADATSPTDGITVTGRDRTGRWVRRLGRIARDRIAVLTNASEAATLIAVAALSLRGILVAARHCRKQRHDKGHDHG